EPRRVLLPWRPAVADEQGRRVGEVRQGQQRIDVVVAVDDVRRLGEGVGPVNDGDGGGAQLGGDGTVVSAQGDRPGAGLGLGPGPNSGTPSRTGGTGGTAGVCRAAGGVGSFSGGTTAAVGGAGTSGRYAGRPTSVLCRASSSDWPRTTGPAGSSCGW